MAVALPPAELIVQYGLRNGVGLMLGTSGTFSLERWLNQRNALAWTTPRNDCDRLSAGSSSEEFFNAQPRQASIPGCDRLHPAATGLDTLLIARLQVRFLDQILTLSNRANFFQIASFPNVFRGFLVVIRLATGVESSQRRS